METTRQSKIGKSLMVLLRMSPRDGMEEGEEALSGLIGMDLDTMPSSDRMVAQLEVLKRDTATHYLSAFVKDAKIAELLAEAYRQAQYGDTDKFEGVSNEATQRAEDYADDWNSKGGNVGWRRHGNGVYAANVVCNSRGYDECVL